MSQSDDFGRRSSRQPRGGEPPDRTPWPSPLFVKQIAGMASGVALALAIGAGSFYTMKQFGKSLDSKFVETAQRGDPQAVIDAIKDGGDAALQRAHKACVDANAATRLTTGHTRAAGDSPSQWFLSGEQAVLLAASYTTCLTTEQPQRFCDLAHRDHLVKAVRGYLKLRRQVREEWVLQSGGPNMQATMRMAMLPDANQVSPVGVPSGQFDPQLRESLRSLAAKGLLTTSAFGRFAGLGTPPEILDVLKGVQTGKANCA